MSSRVLGGRGRWAGRAPNPSTRDVDLLRMAEGSCTEASLRDFLVVPRTRPGPPTPFCEVRRRFRGPNVTFVDSQSYVSGFEITNFFEKFSRAAFQYGKNNTSGTGYKIEEGRETIEGRR